MSVDERKYFYSAITNVKALAQRRSVMSKRLVQPRKGALASVAKMVYRYDKVALRNWTAMIGKNSLTLLHPKAALQRDVVIKLQAEYIDKCVPTDTMLSLPPRSDLRVIQDIGEHGQLGLVASALVQGANAGELDGAERFFIVVNKQPFRKNLLRTSMWRQQQAMGYPASVQWATAVAAGGDDAQRGQLIVRYDGVPEIVDLLELAEWATLRSELSRWEMTVGEVGGVLAIGNRQPVEATVRAWNDEATPTFAILDSLASDGWVRGEPPKVHDSASTKRFSVKDPVRERAYLQCLAALPH